MDQSTKEVWIPLEIWEGKGLARSEKLLLAAIEHSGAEGKNYSTNRELGDFLMVSPPRISNVIRSLIKKECVSTTLIYKKGTKQIIAREIEQLKWCGYV